MQKSLWIDGAKAVSDENVGFNTFVKAVGDITLIHFLPLTDLAMKLNHMFEDVFMVINLIKRCIFSGGVFSNLFKYIITDSGKIGAKKTKFKNYIYIFIMQSKTDTSISCIARKSRL